MDIDTHEIQVRDLHDTTDILHYFAKDSDCFLGLLLLYAEYNAQEMEGINHSLNQRKDFIQQAIHLAGGIRYRPFAEILFGYNTSIGRTVTNHVPK